MSESLAEVAWRDARYRAGLQRCFPSWGDEAFSRWYLARDTGEGSPDLFALASPEVGLVAGTAVSYRRIRAPGRDGREARVAVLSGAWTVPEARGSGCFRRLVAAAAERAAGRGCESLLAFVTADNASRRALEGVGSTLHPTWYCSLPEREDRSGAGIVTAPANRRRPPVPAAPSAWRRLAASARRDRVAAARFVYSPAGWRSQLVDRPDPVELVTTARGATALVELTADTDRLLLVDPPSAEAAAIAELGARAAKAGRHFFCFVSDDRRRRWAVEAGLATKPGYLTLLPTGSEEWSSGALSPWQLWAGDRI